MKELRGRLPSWVLAGILFLAGRAEAHHSFAVFDGEKTVEIRGVVVDFKLRNPPSSLVVDGLAFIDGVSQGNGAEPWQGIVTAQQARPCSPMHLRAIPRTPFHTRHDVLPP